MIGLMFVSFGGKIVNVTGTFRSKLQQVLVVFIRTGFIETLGEDHFLRTRTEAMNYAWDRTYCEREGCTEACYLARGKGEVSVDKEALNEA